MNTVANTIPVPSSSLVSSPQGRRYVEDMCSLLQLASESHDSPERMIISYRAALRGAGALIYASPKKRGLRGYSAWRKMKVIRPDLQELASFFEGYSWFVSRIVEGQVKKVDQQVLDKFNDSLSELYAHVLACGYSPSQLVSTQQFMKKAA